MNERKEANGLFRLLIGGRGGNKGGEGCSCIALLRERRPVVRLEWGENPNTDGS